MMDLRHDFFLLLRVYNLEIMQVLIELYEFCEIKLWRDFGINFYRVKFDILIYLCSLNRRGFKTNQSIQY
jgi:hypothetical protein